MRDKKLVIGIAIIVILVVISCAIVAFFALKGNEEKKTKTTTPTPVVENNVEEDNDEEEKEISIKKVVEKFEKGIALVEDENEKQYVINEKGKVVYEPAEDEEIYVSNGYISTGNYVYDNKGKEVAHDENKKYYKVSKSEYVLVKVELRSVSGTTYVNQIEDLKGNKVSESYSSYRDFESDGYLFEDCYVVYDKENAENIILDAHDHEPKRPEDFENTFLKTTLSTERQDGTWYYVKSKDNFHWFINADFSKVLYEKIEVDGDEYTYKQVLLDKYILAESKQKKTALFTTEGNLVADLTENGGVAAIQTFEDTIYIISDKYIYTVDSELNYIAEPVETEFDALAVTKDGVWGVQTDKNKLILLDKTAKETAEMTDIDDWDLKKIVGHHSTNGDNFIYALKDDVIPSEVEFIYNTETEKMLEISKE